MPYSFEGSKVAWACIPLDELGYHSSREMLRLPDGELLALAGDFEAVRYNSWRNHAGLWRECLGLDSTHGRTVLDFGCGFGIEALQFARLGNRVMLADIVPESVSLAARVLRLHGFEPAAELALADSYPFVEPPSPVDVLYANGVLHHIPYAKAIVDRASEVLAPGGEIRLMLYSDKAWTVKTGASLPAIDADVATHPMFPAFLRGMDPVGFYADWYNREKVERLAEPHFAVRDFRYITPTEIYAVATLIKRDEGSR